MLVTMLACIEPFPEDRHDLRGFRIAAVSARLAGESVDVHAFVYSGLGLWHAEPPEIEWTAGEATAEGVTATLPWAPEIELRAGDETALLTLDDPGVIPVGWARAAVDLTWRDVGDPIESRAEAETGADVPIAPGGAARLTIDADAPTHWMATGGELAELSASSTDWFPVHLPGVHSVVALSFDGTGAAAWTYVDVAVTPGPHLYSGGRIFPVDAAPGDGPFSATVEADDSIAGIRLIDLVPGATGEPFDFATLADGRVTRDSLVGTQIVVDGTVR